MNTETHIQHPTQYKQNNIVRRTYSNYGDRCFAATAPKPSNWTATSWH